LRHVFDHPPLAATHGGSTSSTASSTRSCRTSASSTSCRCGPTTRRHQQARGCT